MPISLLEFLFWVGALFVTYVYVGYPCLLWLTSFLFRPKHLAQPNEHSPLVTVFVPVHNEEVVLEEKITNLFELVYPREHLEFVLASDGSTRSSLHS